MKSVFVVVLLLSAFACAFPRRSQDETKESDTTDTELFAVPLARSPPRRPSFGFGLNFPEDLVPPPLEQNPFFSTNPWREVNPVQDANVDDFMTQMQEMLREMRRQLTDMVEHAHHVHNTGSDPLPDGDTTIVTRIGDDDLPKNKSTSTTKVIDGHVVTVNETTYSSGDDNIGAVFRIKVVEVIPSETPDVEIENENQPSEADGNSEEKNSSDTTPSSNVPTTSKSELDEDRHEETNEIPNHKVGSEVEDLNATTNNR